MMIKAPEAIGGSYQSYAPGHGGLIFIHFDDAGRPTQYVVPRSACEQLIPRGWALGYIDGRIEGYRPYNRAGVNILENEDGLYMYALRDNGYIFYLRDNDSEWELVRNESRRASLRYFLTHEHILTPPPAGEKNNEKVAYGGQ